MMINRIQIELASGVVSAATIDHLLSDPTSTLGKQYLAEKQLMAEIKAAIRNNMIELINEETKLRKQFEEELILEAKYEAEKTKIRNELTLEYYKAVNQLPVVKEKSLTPSKASPVSIDVVRLVHYVQEYAQAQHEVKIAQEEFRTIEAEAIAEWQAEQDRTFEAAIEQLLGQEIILEDGTVFQLTMPNPEEVQGLKEDFRNELYRKVFRFAPQLEVTFNLEFERLLQHTMTTQHKTREELSLEDYKTAKEQAVENLHLHHRIGMLGELKLVNTHRSKATEQLEKNKLEHEQAEENRQTAPTPKLVPCSRPKTEAELEAEAKQKAELANKKKEAQIIRQLTDLIGDLKISVTNDQGQTETVNLWANLVSSAKTQLFDIFGAAAHVDYAQAQEAFSLGQVLNEMVHLKNQQTEEILNEIGDQIKQGDKDFTEILSQINSSAFTNKMQEMHHPQAIVAF